MLAKKDYFLARVRELDLVPEIWCSISQTHPNTLKWHGKKLKSFDTAFIDGKCLCIYGDREFKNLGKSLVKKYVQEPKYFEKVKRVHYSYGKKAQVYARKARAGLETDGVSVLIKKIQKLKRLWLEFDQVNVLPWFLAADPLKDFLKKQCVNRYCLGEQEFELLCAPDGLSLPALEELALYKVALKKKKRMDISMEFKVLSLEFGWIPFGYDGPTYWNEEYYKKKVSKLEKLSEKILLERIKSLQIQVVATKENQIKISKQYGLHEGDKRLFSIFRDLFILTDERKKIEFQLHYTYFLAIVSLSKLSGLKVKELKFLDVEEITEMFATKNITFYQSLARTRISSPLCIFTENGKIKNIFTGKTALERVKRKVVLHTNYGYTKGVVAYKVGQTKLVGRVRKIMNPSEVNSMKKGEILVSHMTTPDFVFAMRKAKAIITDEGGVTCHAAIVSRELGISCMIWTKVSTQIFNSGDLVELDLQNGIVRKL